MFSKVSTVFPDMKIPVTLSSGPYAIWHDLGKQVPAALMATASRVYHFVKQILPALLLWTSVGLAGLLYSQTFVYGMSWGLFLACCDVAIGEKWAQHLPRMERLKPSHTPSPKQYAGLAGTIFLGTLLFGGGASFLVGWVCGEALIDRLGRRF